MGMAVGDSRLVSTVDDGWLFVCLLRLDAEGSPRSRGGSLTVAICTFWLRPEKSLPIRPLMSPLHQRTKWDTRGLPLVFFLCLELHVQFLFWQ